MSALDRRIVLAAPFALPLLAAGQDRSVPFQPTPESTVAAMMELAAVGPSDTLYDLGAGDGRIAIAAAKRGARAIGFEIDPELVTRARRSAALDGVSDRATFRQGDLFAVPLREASVIALYLLPEVNLKLRPRLLTATRPGTRVVSHAFTMGDWRPDTHREVEGRHIYLWIVPAVAGGDWVLTGADGRRRALAIEQRFQDVGGTLDGAALTDAALRGTALRFNAGGMAYEGVVGDAAIDGKGWRAVRAG